MIKKGRCRFFASGLDSYQTSATLRRVLDPPFLEVCVRIVLRYPMSLIVGDESLKIVVIKCLFTRSSPPEVFLRKVVLKICSKFTGERACQRVISIKFQSNFIEITLRHRCSPVHFLNIFRTLFPKNTSRRLLLLYESIFWFCVF